MHQLREETAGFSRDLRQSPERGHEMLEGLRGTDVHLHELPYVGSRRKVRTSPRSCFLNEKNSSTSSTKWKKINGWEIKSLSQHSNIGDLDRWNVIIWVRIWQGAWFLEICSWWYQFLADVEKGGAPEGLAEPFIQFSFIFQNRSAYKVRIARMVFAHSTQCLPSSIPIWIVKMFSGHSEWSKERIVCKFF